MLMWGHYKVWEMTSFLLECLRFSTPAHGNGAVKRRIALQGFISVRVYSTPRFNIVGEKRRDTRRGCLSRVTTCVDVLWQELIRAGEQQECMQCQIHYLLGPWGWSCDYVVKFSWRQKYLCVTVLCSTQSEAGSSRWCGLIVSRGIHYFWRSREEKRNGKQYN